MVSEHELYEGYRGGGGGIVCYVQILQQQKLNLFLVNSDDQVEVLMRARGDGHGDVCQ